MAICELHDVAKDYGTGQVKVRREDRDRQGRLKSVTVESERTSGAANVVAGLQRIEGHFDGRAQGQRAGRRLQRRQEWNGGQGYAGASGHGGGNSQEVTSVAINVVVGHQALPYIGRMKCMSKRKTALEPGRMGVRLAGCGARLRIFPVCVLLKLSCPTFSHSLGFRAIFCLFRNW